ncbi:hypothetical protein [Polyangium aurulentum]|uniref:hypothetical protein n=1 Tax=Polyangium aurulentum TaxID=2567896 RepID=UPI0010AE620E|nr:hypothetical protein [Polyangium aurulentum]UQA56747.1 hypothetical protein E8A73_036415 [Polyangium aurulentum]
MIDAHDEDNLSQDLDALRGKRRRSPYRRLVLLALFALTLPFKWGSGCSCSGGSPVYTGVDLITWDQPKGASSDLFGLYLALILPVLLVTPVLLGLLQHRIRKASVRLVLELFAMFSGFLGTVYCLLIIISTRLLHHSIYLAPWIAAVAPFLMTIDAYQGFAERSEEMLAARRQRRSPTAPEEEVKWPPAGA